MLGKLLQTAAMFAALGDETRLGLLQRLLAEGPMSITRLTKNAGVTRQAVTRHLDVLETAGLVRSRREGRERVWERAIQGQWDVALERFRQIVEAT